GRPAPRWPLSASLFPYTTLFRSPTLTISKLGGFGAGGSATRPPPVGSRAAAAESPCEAGGGCGFVSLPGLIPPPRNIKAAVAARDRKSTRLNSSHLGISYAVFCL